MSTFAKTFTQHVFIMEETILQSFSSKKKKGHLVTATAFSLLFLALLNFPLHVAASSVSSATTASAIPVSGKVTDEKGSPIIGASIVVKGSTTGISSDMKGEYSISVPDKHAILVCSYMGYITQEITVSTQTVINFSMKPDAVDIDQLVVVGYGTQTKKSLTGAVVDVKPSKTNTMSVGSNAELLQGMAPGITVLNNGGSPNSEPFVRIRGMGSLNSESPLWVVDGVVYNGAFVNSNDIESISVLKDASASIYGARASGGVILVTTKKGNRDKIRVEFDAKVGIRTHGKLYEPLSASEYLEMQRRSYLGDGKELPSAFNPAHEDFYWDGQINRTNWVNELFQTGIVQDYNVSISTGGAKHRVYVGGQYRNDEGIILNTHSTSYSFRVNSDFDITPWLKIGETFSLAYTNSLGAPVGGIGGVLRQALAYPPSARVYNDDGSFGGVAPEEYASFFGDLKNPVATLLRRDDNNNYVRTMINPYVEVKLFTEGLKFRSNFSYENLQNPSRAFTFMVPEPGKKTFTNTLKSRYGRATRLLAEQLLTYDRTFNQHSISALLGYTYQADENYAFSVSADGFVSEEEHYRMYANAIMDEYPRPTDSFDQERMLSYVGRLNYNYASKYLFSFTLRRDGSSKLIGKNRWRFYPSISGGWVLSEEKFMKNIKLIDYAKLRVSWGKLGNLSGLGRYGFNALMSQTTASLGESQQLQYGYVYNRPSNPDLRWETSEQFNVGLDLNLFKSNLSISVDYFRKMNHDMITTKDVSQITGYDGGPEINFGQVKNTGIELMVAYKNSAGDFHYDINANFATLKNTFVKYVDNLTYVSVNDKIWSKVGYPIYTFWGYETDGLFQSYEEVLLHTSSDGTILQPNARPGEVKFVDRNDDGQFSNDDRIYLGNPFPKYTFGLNVNLSYKNFDFNMFWSGAAGVTIYNNSKIYLHSNAGNGFNASKEILNAWNPEDPEGSRNCTIPRLTTGGLNNNFRVSDYFTESGDFIKLRNLSLAYKLPSKWLKHLSIENVRLMFSCQNLLTITGYSGLDPEVGFSNKGVDDGVYPVAKTFTFGVNLTF